MSMSPSGLCASLDIVKDSDMPNDIMVRICFEDLQLRLLLATQVCSFVDAHILWLTGFLAHAGARMDPAGHAGSGPHSTAA